MKKFTLIMMTLVIIGLLMAGMFYWNARSYPKGSNDFFTHESKYIDLCNISWVIAFSLFAIWVLVGIFWLAIRRVTIKQICFLFSLLMFLTGAGIYILREAFKKDWSSFWADKISMYLAVIFMGAGIFFIIVLFIDKILGTKPVKVDTASACGFCTACGAPIKQDDAFCSKCGGKLK